MTAAEFITFVASFNAGMITLNREQAIQLLKLLLAHPDVVGARFDKNTNQPLTTVDFKAVVDVGGLTQVKEITPAKAK